MGHVRGTEFETKSSVDWRTGPFIRSTSVGSVRRTWLERGRAVSYLLPMTKHSPFKYVKISPEIIRLAVMMYIRFPLSLRNVDDLLHQRGIDICHETVRYW